MELTNKTINDLRHISNDYMDKLAGREFMREVLWAIDDDELLDYKVEFRVESDKRNPIYAYMGDLKVHFSPEYVGAYLKKLIHEYDKTYKETDYTILYNYVVMSSLIHEVSHLNQMNIFMKNIHAHEEIVRAYRLYYTILSNSRLKRLYFRSNENEDFTERNASLNAARVMASVYEDTTLEKIALDDYIDYLFLGYGAYSCPVKNTCKILGIPDSFDTLGMSPLEKMEIGFKMDYESLVNLEKFINSKSKLTANDIDEHILSLR